jgi:hypothetical protein
MYGTPGGIVEMFGGVVAYWCLAMRRSCLIKAWVYQGKNSQGSSGRREMEQHEVL